MYREISSLAFVALSLSLSACSSSEPISEPSTPREPLAVESAKPTRTQTTAPVPTETRSPRGNLIFQVGDAIDLSAEGSPWATFRVDKMTEKVECTEEWAEPRTKGNALISMEISVETEPDSSGASDDFYLSGYSWKFVDDNGVVFNGELANSVTYSCIAESKLLPDTIGPGTKAKGQILLEIPSTEGTLLSDDYGVEIDLQSALED